MGVWTNELTVMTKHGLNLIAKTPTGASYTLVKAVAGRGKIAEPTAEKLSELTDVCDPVFNGAVMPVEYLGNQMAKITSTFNNALLAEGFECWQIGVYALDPEKGEEILFMVKQATVKDDIPARAVMPLSVTHRDIVFMGNAGEIIYEPPDDLLVYQAEFKPVKAMAEEALKTAREGRLIISGTQPEGQPEGGVWYDTSETQPVLGGDGGIAVMNAVISNEEPVNKDALWFQTKPE